MNKLQGLIEIEKLGLPHPKWEFVKNSSELKYIGEEDEYVGWTVRTCLDKGGDEFNLPHANWLKKEEILNAIENFKKKIKEEATFIVYPSWEFVKGANIMFTKNEIIIEAVKGRLHKLLYGGSPDLNIVFSRTKPPVELVWQGDKGVISDSEYKHLLELNEKVFGNKIFQWSHTTNGKYLFHDLRELKEVKK
jgi:hypothetical protein